MKSFDAATAGGVVNRPSRVEGKRQASRRVMAAVVMLLASSALAGDPVLTDGDKYRVLLENECVRVLDYQDQPGERTRQHRHPPFVLYALGPFKRAIALPDGKVLQREFRQGDVLWSPEQTHIGVNTGETPTHVVIVELKQPAAASPGCAGSARPGVDAGR